MRPQLSGRGYRMGARLARRLDRAAYHMNPYLAALVIGLVILNLTCFIAIQVSLPKPTKVASPISVPVTQ